MDWTTATEEDLLDLIRNRTIENHYLDYKRRDSLLEPDSQKRRNELGKDVSSFAHADGGAIIYGMSEEGKPGRAAELKGLAPDEMSQERLAQLIQTSTQPPGIPVRVRPVELATSDPGRWAFVVAVPRAERAYQAYDHKYHRRDNTVTRTMNHEEIVDVMNRARGPRLDLRFVFIDDSIATTFGWTPENDQGHGRSEAIYVVPQCYNSGNIALYALTRLYVVSDSPGIEFIGATNEFRRVGGACPPLGASADLTCEALEHRRTPQSGIPVFTDETVGLGHLNLRTLQDGRAIGPSVRIYWECIAPDMAARRGGVRIKRAAMTAQIEALPGADVAEFFGI